MFSNNSKIISVGGFLPKRIVTNQELSQSLDTSDEWIQTRVGITQRHLAAPGEFTSDLAVEAAKMALKNASLSIKDIDAIVLATTTPDRTFPSTATIVQHKLGMQQGFAFDVQAVCAGFIYALSTADQFIKSGQANRILVIGAETTSRIINWQDRNTAVLFGDGAGAVILEATNEDSGILGTVLHSDGQYGKLLQVDGGVSTTQTTGHMVMEGREVFRHAVQKLASVATEVLEKTGHTKEDIDWFIPHQANQRIILATADHLGVSHDKVISTVAVHANTSAASIPLALSYAYEHGKIKRGDLILMDAMGGGFTWGAALVRSF